MAYFEPYIDSSGIHIPTYQELMDYLLARYRSIFGENVYLQEDSPDYQMISVFARCLDDYAAFAVDVYNSRNIQYAAGNSLDLLLPLIAMKRESATPSTAVLTLYGTAGTVIPADSKAIDENGYIWSIEDEATIGLTGIVDADAVCETKGAIRADAGTINRIYTAIVGWNAVTNGSAAVKGKNTETDAEVRARQKYIINSYSLTAAESISGALVAIEDVEQVVVRSNDTDEEDDYEIAPHSVACVVDGGDNETIARTIYNKKAPGIGTDGSVTENIADAYGETHAIKFSRPTQVSSTFNVTIYKLANFDADLTEEIIRKTITDYVDGNGIGRSMIIGQLVGMCYAAKPEIASSYVIHSIAVSGGGRTNVTDIFELSWKERVALADNGITFVYEN